MRNISDDPMVWDSEAGYMPMGGMGADTTTAPTSWWQNLLQTAGQTYATVKQAQAAGQPPAPVAPPTPAASGGISTNTMLMIGGLTIAGIVLFSMRSKRR